MYGKEKRDWSTVTDEDLNLSIEDLTLALKEINVLRDKYIADVQSMTHEQQKRQLNARRQRLLTFKENLAKECGTTVDNPKFLRCFEFAYHDHQAENTWPGIRKICLQLTELM